MVATLRATKIKQRVGTNYADDWFSAVLGIFILYRVDREIVSSDSGLSKNITNNVDSALSCKA